MRVFEAQACNALRYRAAAVFAAFLSQDPMRCMKQCASQDIEKEQPNISSSIDLNRNTIKLA